MSDPHWVVPVDCYEKCGAAPCDECSATYLWDAEMAVSELTKLSKIYPNIKDIHFWAQFPGEALESGNRRLNYIAEKVLPRLP